jgi:SAM-dependent methyltransferase
LQNTYYNISRGSSVAKDTLRDTRASQREIKWKTDQGGSIFSGAPTSIAGNEIIVQECLKFLNKIFSSRTKLDLIVDIGCGYGGYTLAAQAFSQNVLGIDAEERFLRKARSKQVPVALAISERLPLKSGLSSTMVFLFEVIEHVNNQDETLDEIRRILDNKEGYLFLMVPNRFFPFERHGFQLNGRSFGNIAGIGVPFLSFLPSKLRRHVERARIYSQKDIVQLLCAHKFKVLTIGYLPPTLDRFRKSTLVDAFRKILFTMNKCSPFRQMGMECLVLAQKQEDDAGQSMS